MAKTENNQPAAEPAPAIPPPRLREAKPAGYGEGEGDAGGRPDVLGAIAILVFVLVGGLLVFSFARSLLPAAQAQLGAACRPLDPTVKEGSLPQLELEDLEGNPVSLEDYRGKFLVLNFWATWCQPCTREWPDLEMLGERLGEREDIEVVAIGLDQDKAALGPYLERMGLSESSVTVLWSKDSEAHTRLGSDKIPDTYFVDRDGELRSVFINVREWGKSAAVRCVEAEAARG